MKAVDGTFDQKTEKVEATLSQALLHSPKSTLYVRGKDSGGFWGPVFAIFSDLTSVSPQNVQHPEQQNLIRFYTVRSTPVVLSLHSSVDMNIQFSIFNLTGRLISTVAHKNITAGSNTISWNGLNDAGEAVPNGIYLARLKTDQGIYTYSFVTMR
jgi:hypothetical protein